MGSQELLRLPHFHDFFIKHRHTIRLDVWGHADIMGNNDHKGTEGVPEHEKFFKNLLLHGGIQRRWVHRQESAL